MRGISITDTRLSMFLHKNNMLYNLQPEVISFTTKPQEHSAQVKEVYCKWFQLWCVSLDESNHSQTSFSITTLTPMFCTFGPILSLLLSTAHVNWHASED